MEDKNSTADTVKKVVIGGTLLAAGAVAANALLGNEENKEKVKDAANQIGDKAKDAVEDLKSKGEDAYQKLKSEFEKVKSNWEDKANSAVNKKDAHNKINDFADRLEKAKDVGKDKAHDTVDKLSQEFEQMKSEYSM